MNKNINKKGNTIQNKFKNQDANNKKTTLKPPRTNKKNNFAKINNVYNDEDTEKYVKMICHSKKPEMLHILEKNFGNQKETKTIKDLKKEKDAIIKGKSKQKTLLAGNAYLLHKTRKHNKRSAELHKSITGKKIKYRKKNHYQHVA